MDSTPIEERAVRYGKSCRGWLFLLAAGLAYLLFVRATDLGLPCPFRYLTGFLCPGCGVTTMLVSLSCLDFHGAWQANPALCLAGPLLLLLEIRDERCWVLKGTRPSYPVWFWPGWLVYFLVFTVYRNIF